MNFLKIPYLITILFAISCSSIKEVELYEFVEKRNNSFEYNDIFIDSELSGVWGVKQNSCKSISFDTLNNFIGKDHLHIKWNEKQECKYLGFGFKWANFKSKNLLPIVNESAIQFMIRIDSGTLNKVPMFFSLVDYSERQCFGKVNILGIEGQIIDQSWRKVIVPLSTFKYEKKGVNMSNIKELRIELQRSGNVHIDDIKIVSHVHNYKVSKTDFSKTYNSFPLSIGNEKKYWWGINPTFSNNFSFVTNSPLSLSINYDKESNDNKWNNFGFPLNRWEYADLSKIYSTSAIQFEIRGSEVPKIQIMLTSYSGDIKKIKKSIDDKNIIQVYDDLFTIIVPVKSFTDYNEIDWTKIKGIRFKLLESTNVEFRNVKIVEFRGNPKQPNKWKGI